MADGASTSAAHNPAKNTPPKKSKDSDKDDGSSQAEKRHRPCSNCVNRRIPHLCRTFDPSTDSSDVTTRLTRLEKMVGDYLPAILDRLDGPRVAGGSRYNPGFRNPPGLGSEEEEEEDLKGSFAPSGMYIGSSTNVYAVGTILPEVPPQEIPIAAGALTIEMGPKAQDLDALLAEYGWPALTTPQTSPTAVLLSALPHRNTCDLLLKHFYDDLNWIRHPLPQRTLRKAFDQFFNDGPRLTLDNLNVFAILALICAMASLTIDNAVFTGRSQSRIVATRRLQWAARQALAMSSATGRGDTDAVLGWHMLCRVMVLERRQEEAQLASSACIKLAQAIGLHRDGSKLKFDPVEAEYRRRCWAFVFTTECYISWHMGRPVGLTRDTIDSQAPSEADDEGDFYPLPKSLPASVASITAMTAHRYRYELGHFFMRICELQQTLKPVPYSEVLAVDRELLEWRDSLPSWFKCPLGPTGAIEMDTSIDEYYPFLPPQRYLLESDFDQCRIGLHRSYLLLSRNKGGSRYLPSRRACVEAAHHDILHRSALVFSMKEKFDRAFINVWNVHYHSTKHFSSVAICGIALLSDPHSAQAATLRGHLVHFLEVAKLKEQHGPDSPFVDMYRREASIIKMFLDKADELAAEPTRARIRSVDESASARKRRMPDNDAGDSSKRHRHTGDQHEDHSGSHGPDGDDHATANVLLGLGQSKSFDPQRSATSATTNNHSTPASQVASTGRSPQDDDAQNILDVWFQGGYQQPANGLLDFSLTGLTSMDLATLPPLPNSNPGITMAKAPADAGLMPNFFPTNVANGMPGMNTQYMPNAASIPPSSSIPVPGGHHVYAPSTTMGYGSVHPVAQSEQQPWTAAPPRAEGAADHLFWANLIDKITR